MHLSGLADIVLLAGLILPAFKLRMWVAGRRGQGEDRREGCTEQGNKMRKELGKHSSDRLGVGMQEEEEK